MLELVFSKALFLKTVKMLKHLNFCTLNKNFEKYFLKNISVNK